MAHDAAHSVQGHLGDRGFGGAVTSPAFATLDDCRVASTNEINQYRSAGHVLIEGIVNEMELASYRPAIASVVERARATAKPLDERSTTDKAFLQLFNLWQHDPVVEEFVTSRRLASIAASLLGVDAVRVYHDQALFKEPSGGITPWHQDALYWPLNGIRCITMWMPLVDIVPEMGAMTFASASHLDGRLSDETISDTSQIEFEQLVAANGYRLSQPQPMHAGDATFHSGWTAHRASANGTTTMREVMTIIWYADGEFVLPPHNGAQEHDLARWLPGCRPGGLAESPMNPLCPSGPVDVPDLNGADLRIDSEHRPS